MIKGITFDPISNALACKCRVDGNSSSEEYFLSQDRLDDLINGKDILSVFVLAECSGAHYIPYWSNEDMDKKVEQYVENADYRYQFPEHCIYTRELKTENPNERYVLAYIDNAVNPYVRMESKATTRQLSFLECSFGLESMVKRISKYPIVGFGFPAFLSVHVKVEKGFIVFPNNPDELFEQYFRERKELFSAIHSAEYHSWNSKLKSKWEGEEAKQHIEKLDNTFAQLLLKQEQKNSAASSELLSLYTGKLDKYVEYFIEYLKGKLSISKPQPQRHKPQETQENSNKTKPNFKDYIQSVNGKSTKDILKRLHELIDQSRPKIIGAVLLKAYTEKYITQKPSKKIFESEFTLNCSWSGISKYMNPNTKGVVGNADRILIFDLM